VKKSGVHLTDDLVTAWAGAMIRFDFMK
jgi:hypothetical protein